MKVKKLLGAGVKAVAGGAGIIVSFTAPVPFGTAGRVCLGAGGGMLIKQAFIDARAAFKKDEN